MRTRSIRIGMISLAIVALLGLLVVACHKKEGTEQSQMVAPPAPQAVTAPAPQVPVAVVAESAQLSPAPKAAPAPGAERQEPVRLTVAAAEPVQRPSEALHPSLPGRPRPQGAVVDPISGREIPLPEPPLGPEDKPSAQGMPLGLHEGPTAMGDTVDVSTLPTDEPPNLEVVYRTRRPKPAVPLNMDPNAEAPTTQILDPASAGPSRLEPVGEGRAPINPGSPAVSKEIFNASNTDGVPFDVDMGVGTNHIITAVNTRFRIYDKSGNLVQNDTTYRAFFAAGGATPNCGAAEGTNSFLADPQVVFDEKNNRWVMAILRVRDYAANTSSLCLACSQTGDPTGVWNKYEFSVPSALLADYPHLGVGEDAIFIGVNDFTDTAYSGATGWAFNKTQAYAGGAVASTTFSWGANYFTPQPAEVRGYFQGQYPATNIGHYFTVRDNNGNVDIYRWPKPTFSNTPAVYANDALLSGGQPPDIGANGSTITTKTIDGGDNRPMDAELRWPYLWMTRGALSGSRGSIQWWGGDVSGGSPASIQTNNYTVADRTLHWPDCTVDKANNFAVGFTGADNATGVFPSAYITGRETGITGANALENYITSKAGDARYDTWEGTPGSTTECGTGVTCGPVRWGDYAGVVVDPNGCDIWFHGQYSTATAAGDPQTKTWLRKFKFPSCSVTNNLTLDDTRYTCSDTMTIVVEDSTAVTAAELATAVQVTSSTDSEHITAVGWTDLSGTGTKWQATLPISSSTGAGNDNGTLNVANGVTLTATYTDPHGGHPAQTRSPVVDCQVGISDGGYLIRGGCDNAAAGEVYNAYMDAGEYSAYTFGFVNDEGYELTNATATLSLGGAGASFVTIYNPTVVLGSVPNGGLAGGVFNLYVSPTVTDLSAVTLTLSVTSPADGLTTPSTLVHNHILDADDTIVTYRSCQQFTSGMTGYSDQVVTGGAANPWAQVANATVTGENRTDGGCFAAANGAAVSSTTTFAAGADSVLTKTPIQPANINNAPNGQPYNYIWKYHTFYGAQETAGNTSGAWGVFWNDQWNSSTTPTGDQIMQWADGDCCYYQTVMDWASSGLTAWDWHTANTGTADATTGAPPNQFVYRFPYDQFGAGWRGLATSSSYFSWGHEHFDINTTVTGNADIGIDNDQLIYDTFYASADSTPCASGSQTGRIAWDKYIYSTCPTGTATLSVMDDNATAPFTATVTSGVGDSETVTFSGSAPYFTGTITLSTNSGVGTNNGTLYVVGTDTLTATYSDTNPVGTTTATAYVEASIEPIAIQSRTVTDNGDNDGYADTNETVSFSLTLANSGVADLHNVTVRVLTTAPSSQIDCILNDTASFGTILAGGTGSNPSGQEFKFHVNSTYVCSNPDAPATVLFRVVITGDELCAPALPQTTSIYLDIDPVGGFAQGVSLPERNTSGLVTLAYAGNKSDRSAEVSELPPSGAAVETLKGAVKAPTATTCGNAYYDDTLRYDAVYFYGGSHAGDPNYMTGVLFDPADFGLAGVNYKISEVCFANDYVYSGGVDQPTRFYIYADNNGVPVDATPLYTGVKHWGTGTGASIVSISPAIAMTANSKFWVMQRGDAAYTASLDLVWESDTNNFGQTYGSTTGIAGLALDPDSQAIYHANILPNVVCDTADNSGLPSCTEPYIIYDSHGTFTQVTGDGDSNYERGEKWSVPVTLKNMGNITAHNVTATFGGNGITVCTPTQNFGTMAPGATATLTFEFVISTTFAPCGDPINFNITGKTCTEKTPAGPDQNGVFNIAHVAQVTTSTPVELVIQPSTGDSYIVENSASTNYGTAATMLLYDRNGRANRSLVQFSLAGIPAGATINSATLELYNTAAATTARAVDVHRITASWAEGTVTWATQPAFAATAETQSTPSTAIGWKTFNATAAVQGWYAGTYPNYGLVVKNNVETQGAAQGYNTYTFATRENGTTGNRPILRVNYTPADTYDCTYVGSGSCGTCTAPSSLTNNGAADLNSMADTGVQVTWAQDAGDWGDGGSGTRTYDVLRAGTPIQSGIAYGTTTYTDTTGVNGTSYTYAVRYNNGCGQNATTVGTSAADWIDPGETAATSGLTWQSGSKTQLNWTANVNALTYNLYRGVKADLPNLLNASNDSCTRYTDTTNSATNLSETNGSAGDFYWFLVTGVNGGGGEGTAGNATAGPRIINSTGTCP